MAPALPRARASCRRTADARSGRSASGSGRSRDVCADARLVCESRRGMKTAGAPSAPAVCSVCGQRRRPALADIIGPRRAWTVAMISSVSIPCR